MKYTITIRLNSEHSPAYIIHQLTKQLADQLFDVRSIECQPTGRRKNANHNKQDHGDPKAQ